VHRERIVAVLCCLLPIFAAGCGKFSRPTDEAIVTGIQAKMFSEPSLKAASITVTAKDGVVTLTGQLPDEAARQAAQKIASEANGVSKIIDQMTIGSQQAAATPAPVAELKPRPKAEPKPARAASAPKKRSSAAVREQQDAESASPPVVSTDVIPQSPSSQTPEPGPIQQAAVATPAAAAAPPAPPKPQPVTVTIPEGEVLSVRTSDPIDSKVNQTGETFRASLDAPIVVDNQVVVPKGLNVTLKLVNASSAGKMAGRSELTVSLESFTYQGKKYTVASSDVQQKGGSRGKRSAEVIGGGAVLGAIIGGLAGGGKGAAIGAAAGGGGGAAVQVLTKGQQVKIPAETKLDFTLHAPIEVTYLPGKKLPRPNPDDAAPDAPAPAPATAPPAASPE
jgi:BON domain-containing protein